MGGMSRARGTEGRGRAGGVGEAVVSLSGVGLTADQHTLVIYSSTSGNIHMRRIFLRRRGMTTSTLLLFFRFAGPRKLLDDDCVLWASSTVVAVVATGVSNACSTSTSGLEGTSIKSKSYIALTRGTGSHSALGLDGPASALFIMIRVMCGCRPLLAYFG